MFLKRSFNVFAETKPSKICLFLVSKSTFLCNVFKTFFKPFCGNQAFENMFYFGFQINVFVVRFLKRYFYVFFKTELLKICLVLVSKSTFLCNVFKTFFKRFCGNQAFENMFYFGFQINVFVVRFLKRYFYAFFKTELLKIRLVLVSKLTFLCNVFKAFFNVFA